MVLRRAILYHFEQESREASRKSPVKCADVMLIITALLQQAFSICLWTRSRSVQHRRGTSGMSLGSLQMLIAKPSKQIQERIKALDFQDCKVRVSNVDSQASEENIVIQVIGETCNKNGDPKKFVQTFILAEQPSGYFVLNDIFRYIKEEEDEEVAAEAPEEAANAEEKSDDVEAPKAQIEEATPDALDADLVDEKLEETIKTEPEIAEVAPITNGTTAEEKVEPAAEAPTEPEVAPTPDVAEKEVEAETVAAPEAPKDPLPTPAATRAPSATKVPVVPAAPAKPMSWASRAAAAATPKPAVPQIKPASPAATQTRAPPATAATPAAPAPAPAAAAPATAATSDVKSDKENQSPEAKSDGWTAVTDNAKRQNRPQSVSQPMEKEGTMGYIRNVQEAVQADDLKEALNKFGEVTYFDINRQKNCAFVEFKEPAGYQGAAKASPLKVNGQDIYVEARRPKTGAYGGAQFNNNRGGAGNNRGRGNFGGQQSGNRGRGDFGGANRGRGGAQRGRGGANAQTAA